jgi:hypothetical protein
MTIQNKRIRSYDTGWMKKGSDDEESGDEGKW